MAETVLETLVIKVDSDTTSAEAGLAGLQKTLSKFKSAAAIGSSGTKKLSSSFTSVTSKAHKATAAFRIASNTFGSWFKESNDYVEALNLFNVAMGDCSDAAMIYAKNVEAVMGIDLKEWLTYQGAFYQLADGYGIASESAKTMSQNLTQLAYDLSSLWNVDTKTAFQKLQSGMSGQIKGLKVWGINVSVAQLRQTALAHGIDLSTAKMTEAQKATLRYITIMEQTTNAQGDLARTIITPSNALRILNAQWTQAKRAMGQVVSVIAVKVIPWFQALVQIIKEAAQSLATTLGYDYPKIDYPEIDVNTDSFDDAADSLGEAAGNAKELKKSILGIDELNVLTDNSASSAADSLGGGYASDFGLDLSKYNYDFLSNVQMPDLEPFKQKLKDTLKLVGLISLGIGTWKLTNFILDIVGAKKKAGGLKALLESIGKKNSSLAFGITLAVVGIALEADGIISAIQEGLNGINFTEILGGGGSIVAGGALIGKFFGSSLIGSAVGGIVAGIPMFVTGVYDAVTNGLNILNGLLIPAGSTLAGAGIGAIIGSLGGPIGAGVGALIGLGVGLITDGITLLVQNWDTVSNWVTGVLSTIGQFFSEIWSDIVVVWNMCAGWFDANVIQPIVGFFSDLWTSISSAASICWNAIVEFFSPAIEWFSQLFGSIWQTVSDIFYNIGVIVSGCWEVIKAVWGIVSEWFNINIITPVGNFFSNLWTGVKNIAITAWEGIKSVFSTISGWINENIIQPVANFFSVLWDGFVDKASAAWEGVKSVFSKVATFFSNIFSTAWQGIVKVFSVAGEIFVDIKDGIISAFKFVVNGIIKGLNRVIAIPFNGINSALNRIKEIEIVGIKPFEALRSINVPQIPLLAEGGFPSTGEMFIAREAGPEMVGTIGNKSAVANNDQIVSGIQGGVYAANQEQNALLREQNSILRKLLEKDETVHAYVTTSDIEEGLLRKNRRNGVTTVPVG